MSLTEPILQVALPERLKQLCPRQPPPPPPLVERGVGSDASLSSEAPDEARDGGGRETALGCFVKGEAAPGHPRVEDAERGREQRHELQREIIGNVAPVDLPSDVLAPVLVKEAGLVEPNLHPARPERLAPDPAGNRAREKPGVLSLQVDRLALHEGEKGRALVVGHGAEERGVRAAREVDTAHRAQGGRRRARRDDAAAPRPPKVVADGDQRLCQRAKRIIGGAVQDRDLIIRIDGARAVLSIDLADSFHAEAVQLGGPERADARGAKDPNATLEREQDLPVKYGGRVEELPVDDADDVG